MAAVIPSRERIIQEIVRCTKDPIYFIQNYVYIQHPQKGKIKFNTYDFQDKCVKEFLDHRFNIVLKARQLGLSTLVAAYCLWLSVFHKNKSILVLATKLDVAQNFIKKVKFMKDSLPPFLALAKVVGESKKHLEFSNGSQVKAIPTTDDAGRSEALTLLIVDEAAFIDGFEEIYKSIFPTLSAGGSAILISSPKGTHGVFYDTWVAAEAGKNEYNPIKLMWSVHPDRDEAWFRSQAANMTAKDLAQEHMCLCAGAKILTIEGHLPIEEIKVGTEVITHKGRIKKVTKVFTRTLDDNEHLFKIRGVTHDEESSLRITGNHPIFGIDTINNRPAFTPADEIFQDDWYGIFLDEENAKLKYEAVTFEFMWANGETVYNFEVEDDHSYIANGLIVHNCDFSTSGDTYIAADDILWLKSCVTSPIEMVGQSRDIWVWKQPVVDHKYIISADVARGTSDGDFSTFQIIDIDETEQVAEYQGKLPPEKLHEPMIEMGYLYNTALICVENNSFGYTTAVELQKSKYPKLYYEDYAKESLAGVPIVDESVLPGYYQHLDRDLLMNKMDSLIRNKIIKLYSSRLVREFETFITNSRGKPVASKGKRDDLVMALAIGIWISNINYTVNNINHLELAKALLTHTGVSSKQTNLPGITRPQQIFFGTKPLSSQNTQAHSEAYKEALNLLPRNVSQQTNPYDFGWMWQGLSSSSPKKKM